MYRYGRSKLANIWFTQELDRRMQGEGLKNFYAQAVDPGFVASNLSSSGKEFVGPLIHVVRPITNWMATSPEKSSITPLFAITSKDIEEKALHGRYFMPVMKDVTAELSQLAADTTGKHGKSLWTWSEQQITPFLT